MTTVTKGISARTATGLVSWVDYYSHVGNDGKFTLIDSVPRLKHNVYTMTRHQSVATKKRTADGFIVGGANLPNFTSNDQIALINKLDAKVQGHDLNAAVFVAEGKQTVELITSNLLSVARALIDVKHGNFLRAQQRLGLVASKKMKRAPNGVFKRTKGVRILPHEEVSAKWLELQYGWLPLLSDVYEGCKAYDALTSPLRTYFYKVSTRRNVVHDSTTAVGNFSCPTTTRLEQRLIYEMLEQNVGKARSLGLEDPLTVAWELVPYSFVVDWFIPIGPWLSAAHAAPKLTGRWCKTTCKHSVCARGIPQNLTYYKGGTYWHDIIRVDRTFGTGGFFVPPPTFKPLDKALSPLHVTNAIALASQLLARP